MFFIGQQPAKPRPEERESTAAAVASHHDAARQIKLNRAREELLRRQHELEQLGYVGIPAAPGLPERSSATKASDSPQVRREQRLRSEERQLQALVADLERQEAAAFAEWQATQDVPAAADRDAALRAEFERQEKLSREERFAAWKLRQGRS